MGLTRNGAAVSQVWGIQLLDEYLLGRRGRVPRKLAGPRCRAKDHFEAESFGNIRPLYRHGAGTKQQTLRGRDPVASSLYLSCDLDDQKRCAVESTAPKSDSPISPDDGPECGFHSLL